MRMRTKKLKSAPVGVIGKVLRILELLDRSTAGLPLKDIAEQTQLNKSTAHRFLSHLEMEGYLFRDAMGSYMLGPKMVRMGSGLSFQATFCKISRPVLEEVWKLTGETVNLAVLDGTEVLYLDVIESLHTFRLATEVGMRRPVHCTSLGKAVLAALEGQPILEEIFKAIKFVPATPKAITNLVRLKKDLVTIRARSYAVDDEEAVSGARCIGAAILDGDSKVIGGISMSGPVVRVTRAHVPQFSAAICSAAAEISRKLGYKGPVSALAAAATAQKANTAPLKPLKMVQRAS
jgi:IclR family KDG regulon transcriptional repressor